MLRMFSPNHTPDPVLAQEARDEVTRYIEGLIQKGRDMPDIDIPGLKIHQVTVTDFDCDPRRDEEEISQALEELGKAARSIVKNWPLGKKTRINFVLTVEKGEYE